MLIASHPLARLSSPARDLAHPNLILPCLSFEYQRGPYYPVSSPRFYRNGMTPLAPEGTKYQRGLYFPLRSYIAVYVMWKAGIMLRRRLAIKFMYISAREGREREFPMEGEKGIFGERWREREFPMERKGEGSERLCLTFLAN